MLFICAEENGCSKSKVLFFLQLCLACNKMRELRFTERRISNNKKKWFDISACFLNVSIICTLVKSCFLQHIFFVNDLVMTPQNVKI